MKHIKRLDYINGTWVIELWNTQIISNINLAAAIEEINAVVWPQPELSVTMKIEELALELAAA